MSDIKQFYRFENENKNNIIYQYFLKDNFYSVNVMHICLRELSFYKKINKIINVL
jgi:hypothetical protein